MVFAHLMVVQRRRTLAHVGIVTLSVWILSEAFYLTIDLWLSSSSIVPIEAEAVSVGSAIKGLAIVFSRAAAGSILGWVYLRLRARP